MCVCVCVCVCVQLAQLAGAQDHLNMLRSVSDARDKKLKNEEVRVCGCVCVYTRPGHTCAAVYPCPAPYNALTHRVLCWCFSMLAAPQGRASGQGGLLAGYLACVYTTGNLMHVLTECVTVCACV